MLVALLGRSTWGSQETSYVWLWHQHLDRSPEGWVLQLLGFQSRHPHTTQIVSICTSADKRTSTTGIYITDHPAPCSPSHAYVALGRHKQLLCVDYPQQWDQSCLLLPSGHTQMAVGGVPPQGPRGRRRTVLCTVGDAEAKKIVSLPLSAQAMQGSTHWLSCYFLALTSQSTSSHQKNLVVRVLVL